MDKNIKACVKCVVSSVLCFLSRTITRGETRGLLQTISLLIHDHNREYPEASVGPPITVKKLKEDKRKQGGFVNCRNRQVPVQS